MAIIAYKDMHIPSIIEQMPMHRDWMDETFDRHAYQCFPVSMANRIGWSISFKEDIKFIWDGINSSQDGHVSIINGGEYVSTKRANRTVSFDTGIIFSPEYNISLLTMPPPNIFIDGIQCMTTITSTTALIGALPIAIMITRPNIEITIPAKTPIASVLPISLTEINNTELIIKSGYPDFMKDADWNKKIKDRSASSQEKNSKGEWTHFYRDAIDHNGEKMGEHEVKKILMKVTYEN